MNNNSASPGLCGDTSFPGLRVAGVDEAGRGPLAGPVLAAAVILDPAAPIVGLNDSKRLTAARRTVLAAQIRQKAWSWAIAEASAEEIDAINILQASLLAMQRAVLALPRPAQAVVVDGVHLPRLDLPMRAVIDADASIAEVAAASILAKVERDARLLALHQVYPQYGFDRHKGYPTPQHIEALRRCGPCPQHRRSFAPVRAVL